ncbi:MAG: DUF2911 domain-containing protein [Rhodothermales bacterium]|nr:DUF2911 domain-containing protein [Rhodothermales bacterium]
MRILLPLCTALLLAGLAAGAVQAQDLHPSRRPSPIGIAKTHLGDTYVKVTYGRPYMRGRQIFGTPTEDTPFLVPFGEVWRTGANEATEITATGPVQMAGQRLGAGTYSIFTVPGPDTWTIHVSPQLGLDGTGRLGPDGTFTPNVFDPAENVLTFTVPAGTISGEDPVEQFTMAFEPDGDGAHLVLRWERTEVRIPLVPVGS